MSVSLFEQSQNTAALMRTDRSHFCRHKCHHPPIRKKQQNILISAAYKSSNQAYASGEAYVPNPCQAKFFLAQ
jgi:hypothetical protein